MSFQQMLYCDANFEQLPYIVQKLFIIVSQIPGAFDTFFGGIHVFATHFYAMMMASPSQRTALCTYWSMQMKMREITSANLTGICFAASTTQSTDVDVFAVPQPPVIPDDYCASTAIFSVACVVALLYAGFRHYNRHVLLSMRIVFSDYQQCVDFERRYLALSSVNSRLYIEEVYLGDVYMTRRGDSRVIFVQMIVPKDVPFEELVLLNNASFESISINLSPHILLRRVASKDAQLTISQIHFVE